MPLKTINNKAELEAALKENKDKLVVIDYYAEWCGPCMNMAPHYGEMAKQYEGEAQLLKINIDNCEALADEAGVQSIPAFHFYKNGALVDKMIGANTNALRDKIVTLKGPAKQGSASPKQGSASPKKQ